MKVCSKCKEKMRCKKTGMIVRYGIGHCYAGDKFECSKCGAEIIVCNNNSFFSQNEPNPEILVQMD